MFNLSTPISLLLGFSVIVALVVSKYFSQPIVYVCTLAAASFLYQREANRENKRIATVEEALINISKFIIVTGVLGFLIIRLAALFFPHFD